MRSFDVMTKALTSVSTFLVNRFNYHDRMVEDKRANDMARLSREPWNRWPDPEIEDVLEVHLQFPNLGFFFTFSRTKYRVASKSFQIELLDVSRQPIKLF